MSKVYLVMYAEYDWDTHQIASAWSTEEKAEEAREKFHEYLEKETDMKHINTYVDDLEVDAEN